MAEQDSGATYRRRLEQEKLHLDFLYHLALHPESIQPEIKRRKDCITEALESVRLHTEAIQRLENQRDSVYELMELSAKHKQRFEDELNKLSIAKYIAEYIQLNKQLERETNAGAN